MDAADRARIAELTRKDIDPKKLEDKARAQITWGEAPAKVERMLLGQGCDPAMAKEIIGRLRKERIESMVEKGRADLMKGGGMLALGVLVVAGEVTEILHLGWIFMGLGGFGVLAGLFVMARGLERVRHPERQRDADTIYS